jgi:hypothetical protein
VRSILVDVLGWFRLACGAGRGAFRHHRHARAEATETVAAWSLRFAGADPPTEEDLDALDARLAQDPGSPAPDFAPLDAELARLRRSARARARRGRGKPAA